MLAKSAWVGGQPRVRQIVVKGLGLFREKQGSQLTRKKAHLDSGQHPKEKERRRERSTSTSLNQDSEVWVDPTKPYAGSGECAGHGDPGKGK